MSNKQLKRDLSNAKARLKAAQKKLSKIETSDDNQAIAEAQSKVDLEQELIDDIEKQLATRETVDNEEPKSFKEIIALVNTEEPDDVDSRSTRRSKDNPQVSFRTDEVIYQRLKEHIKHPTSKHLKPYLSMADMTRSLNLADLDCDIHFILKRTHQQLARFLDVAKADKSELQASEKQMLRNAFINFHADTDVDKIKLIEHLENLHQFIETLNLYSFEDE
ncbi:MAG: hypothetical protein AAGE96_06305 [Cyanobacteria bacterium P01_G01_bin.19]